MKEKNRIWLSLGAALLASSSLAGGTLAAKAEGKGLERPSQASPAPIAKLQLAAGEAAEAGEGGEGGEGANAADLSKSDSAYLTQLGLMRGHLNVGVELYRLGQKEHAATHMKHPESELYGDLADPLKDRGAPGFEAQLEALAQAVEQDQGAEKVQAAYDAVLAAIGEAESVVANPSPHEIGEVIRDLMRNVAEEYGQAVDDGAIVEGHEYQDSLGFLRTSELWLAKLEQVGASAEVVSEIRGQIAEIMPAWPSVVPPEKAVIDPSVVFGAAARVEIATLGLER